MKTYYIHTIKGQAATFDGQRIRLAHFHTKPNFLVTSLRQIRKEQIISAANRKKAGLKEMTGLSYRSYYL